MSFSEIIAVCSNSHKKHTFMLCGKKAELRTALVWVITQLFNGNFLRTFRDNLPVPSSEAEKLQLAT